MEYMTINGHPAFSGAVENDQYVMKFPQDAIVTPPFVLASPDGQIAETITDYTEFVLKQIIPGEMMLIYGKPNASCEGRGA